MNEHWIKHEDSQPMDKDLPFISYMKDKYDDEIYELWEDADWYAEQTEKERFEWTHWLSLKPPE